MMSFKTWIRSETTQTNLTPPSAGLSPEEGWVYHGTNHVNLHDIADSGFVDTFKPWHGTEQDAWPDGSTERRSYWTRDPAQTVHFTPEGGRPVIIRTRFDPRSFRVESGTGDVYGRKRIPASAVEALVGDRWTPLSQALLP